MFTKYFVKCTCSRWTCLIISKWNAYKKKTKPIPTVPVKIRSIWINSILITENRKLNICTNKIKQTTVISSSSSGTSSSFNDRLRFWTDAVSGDFFVAGDNGDACDFVTTTSPLDNVISICGDCWRFNRPKACKRFCGRVDGPVLYAFACFSKCSCSLKSISNVGLARA